MYNGIGLQTARGSGTNGYVQRNLSLVKQIKKPVEYKSEEDFARLERELNRAPNQEILEHQNKRQIELKCLEMRELMEQQGFNENEIEVKIKEHREELKARMEKKVRNKAEWLLENFPQNVKETHQMAEVNQKKNDSFHSALKISPFFIAGSSLDPTRKAREELEKQEQMLRTKRYAFVPDKEQTPEPEVKSNNKSDKKDSKKSKKIVEKKRKSRKDSSDSDSDSDSDKSDSSDDSYRKKKLKSKDKKKDKKRQKSSDKKSKKKRKYSSSSGSDSDSRSRSRSSSSSSDAMSKTSDSSGSSNYSSKNSRSKRSSRSSKKRSVSPLWPGKSRKSDPKELTYGKDYNKSIAMNIRKVRNEAENRNSPFNNNRRTPIRFKPLEDHNYKDDKKSPHKSRISRSPVRRDRSRSPSVRRSHSRSRSSSRSRSRSLSRSRSQSRPKRAIKSTVYTSNPLERGPKVVPKSYSDKRRSLSPSDRSRHSSRSRSRSRSRSYDSGSSSSRSKSYRRSRSLSRSSKSKSKSRSVSSKSKSRSRSRSIPRRKGSPSFLDKRRITRY